MTPRKCWTWRYQPEQPAYREPPLSAVDWFIILCIGVALGAFFVWALTF